VYHGRIDTGHGHYMVTGSGKGKVPEVGVCASPMPIDV
jgi:hypothetical protein